ncbi:MULTISPECIES: hypothetical protein [Nocardiopsidaceae]|uniref:Uncharacterized protein n=2 Tax=Nocardiopsidaceae TaxID=83676 RepID=A0ABY6YSR4_9ACTN|nr:hypothetical protein [Streptomonospora nanhaiensis]WAE75232.1 hypothetical protein OUQ99_09210 [Streptomonospora nanhaiensis]
MPRLSHTFDITAVDREVVGRIVSALHEVARGCRFDGRGWLLPPDPESWERLVARADELGLVDRESAEELREERRDAAARLREGSPRTEAEADELEVTAAELALQLQTGRHLAPRSHYLVAELSPEGVPVEPADDEEKGWSGTGLTVTAWDETGTSSVDFSMPDAVGGTEPPVTWGTVTHDAPAGLLTWAAEVKLPGRGAWLRSASGEFRFSTGDWYSAVSGRGGGRPARLRARHAVAEVDAWLAPTAGADGRWSVEAVLDVRGKGVFRPVVSAAVWAAVSSFRRAERRAARLGTGEPTTRQRLDRTALAWDRIARNAPRLPELLHDLAAALAAAGPRGGSR